MFMNKYPVHRPELFLGAGQQFTYKLKGDSKRHPPVYSHVLSSCIVTSTCPILIKPPISCILRWQDFWKPSILREVHHQLSQHTRTDRDSLRAQCSCLVLGAGGLRSSLHQRIHTAQCDERIMKGVDMYVPGRDDPLCVDHPLPRNSGVVEPRTGVFRKVFHADADLAGTLG